MGGARGSNGWKFSRKKFQRLEKGPGCGSKGWKFGLKVCVIMGDAVMDTKRCVLRRVAREGFTLIEVLLVVVIIGILVGVAVPKLSGRVKQSQVAAARAGIENVSTALRLYELDMGQFPSSLQGLVQNPGGTKGWRGPYLEKGMPKDPWGNDYVYASPGNNNQQSFDLKSLGPDGVDSADDVTNWSTE